MSLKKTKLGSQGLVVPEIAYGCMGLTNFYGSKLPDEEILALLDKVYDLGVTFWDTASLYAFFAPSRLLTLRSPLVRQDEIIAKAIKKIGRENIQLAHKTGIQLSFFPKVSVAANGDPSFIRKECESALERIGTSYIDLFYLHRIDQSIPIEVSMMEMKRLVEEGKVKYVGLSECSEDTIRRAHKIHPLTAVQLEYSLWCRGIEEKILPVCKELGIGLVAYSPLGRGFFGGAHKKELSSNDFRNSQERFKSEENKKMYLAVDAIADSKKVKAAQLALAWVTAQQDRAAGVVAIPGTTKEKNLVSNVESVKIYLSPEDLKTLEDAVPMEKVEGTRYADISPGFTWETDKNPPLTAEAAKKWGL